MNFFASATNRTVAHRFIDENGYSLGFGFSLPLPDGFRTQIDWRFALHDLHGLATTHERYDMDSVVLSISRVVTRSGRHSFQLGAGAGSFVMDAVPEEGGRWYTSFPDFETLYYSQLEVGQKRLRAVTLSATYRAQGPGAWGLGIEVLLALVGSDSYLSVGVSPFSSLF